MVSKNLIIGGYVTFTTNAKKDGNKGRPSGSLLAAAKPHFEPKLKTKDENYIVIETNIANFINCYYNPTFQVDDICEQLSELLRIIDENKVTYIVGDFNCRIDNNSIKGTKLINYLVSENFSLLNRKLEHTYISKNGNSTIDLIFANFINCTKEIKVNKTFIRKHQVVTVSANIPHLKPKAITPNTRKIDLEKLIEHKNNEYINEKAFTADINTLVKNINEIIQESTETKKNHFHKLWFDQECKQLKAECIAANHLDPGYYNIKKTYKSTINRKRISYTENKLIESFDCRLLQWSLFKKKPPHFATEMTVDTLQIHFDQLLRSDTIPTLQINSTSYETWCDDLFTNDEIETVIYEAKSRNATGPDLISYKQVKQSMPILETEWELLINRCMIEGQIPEIWKESNMHILYK